MPKGKQSASVRPVFGPQNIIGPRDRPRPPPQSAKPKSNQNNKAGFTNQKNVGFYQGKGALTEKIHPVKSRERLATVTVQESGGVTVIKNGWFGFQGLRIAKMFEIYEKWFVRKFTYHFVPILSKTAGGSLMIAPDYDVRDPPPSDNSQLTRYMGGRTIPVCERGEVNMPNFKLPDGLWMKNTMYTVDPEGVRNSHFGQIMFGVEGTGLAVGSTVGYLDIEYDMDFLIPAVEGLKTTIEDSPITELEIITSAAPNGRAPCGRAPILTNAAGTAVGRLYFQDAAHNAILVHPDETIVGEISTEAGTASLVDGDGNELTAGTAVCATGIAGYWNLNTDSWVPMTQAAGSSVVAGIWLGMQPYVNASLVYVGSLGGQILLNNVKKLKKTFL